MRVYVVLCVQDADKMKLTFCIDSYKCTYVRLSTANNFLLLKIFFFFSCSYYGPSPPTAVAVATHIF